MSGAEKGRLKSLREVFRIGNGPSSSHTIGPTRAAQLFKERTRRAARYCVTLCGSLGATGLGHMTQRAVSEALAPAPCEIRLAPERILRHANALEFAAFDEAGRQIDSWIVYSIGGGAIEDETGPILSGPPVTYPVSNIAEALAWCERSVKPFWALVDETEPGIWDYMREVWQVMGAAVRRGMDSGESILPGGLNVPRKAEMTYDRAQTLGGIFRDLAIIAGAALAVAEENAAGNVVVTAPTCGSAGVLPAILHYFATVQGRSERQVLRALATAGLFGDSVVVNASVAGAEVGCQGEVGTACAMAAAAAAQLLGGTPHQVEYAAEMALEHHLGLTCDPVQGLVQIPCIERNAVAAMRALECATYALLGDGRHIISFDEAVEVMAQTGRDLQSAYKETAMGGLAELWRRHRERLEPKPRADDSSRRREARTERDS